MLRSSSAPSCPHSERDTAGGPSHEGEYIPVPGIVARARRVLYYILIEYAKKSRTEGSSEFHAPAHRGSSARSLPDLNWDCEPKPRKSLAPTRLGFVGKSAYERSSELTFERWLTVDEGQRGVVYGDTTCICVSIARVRTSLFQTLNLVIKWRDTTFSHDAVCGVCPHLHHRCQDQLVQTMSPTAMLRQLCIYTSPPTLTSLYSFPCAIQVPPNPRSRIQ